MTITIGTWIFPLIISFVVLGWSLAQLFDDWGLCVIAYGIPGFLLTWLAWALMKVWGWI